MGKKATIDGIREFIKMYEMQDALTVLKCANGYQVSHATSKDDYDVYVCTNITAAAECVNDIIFNLPMGCHPNSWT